MWLLLHAAGPGHLLYVQQHVVLRCAALRCVVLRFTLPTWRRALVCVVAAGHLAETLESGSLCMQPGRVVLM
jgi:hypothetical protein